MKKNRLLSLFLVLSLIAVLLTGCGGSSPNEMAGDSAAGEQWTEPGASVDSELGSSSQLSTNAVQNRKLIRRVSIDAETKTYDELLDNLDKKITSLEGYVESREADTGSSYYYSGSRYNRYTHMVIRIPADCLNEFITHVSTSANVTYTSETTEDITLQYVDTAARVEALKTEQARLLELLEEAQNLTEILEIEARLSDVSYELESYASQMRTYDNLVDYATVNLSISEVQELTPAEEPTVWARISNGFEDSLGDIADGATDLFVWFIVNLPKLVIWTAVLTGIYFFLRGKIKKKKSKNEPPAPGPVKE